jgi:phosphate-selective porin
MTICKRRLAAKSTVLASALLALSGGARAADKELLDILLGNGAITREQYDRLIQQDTVTRDDLVAAPAAAAPPAQAAAPAAEDKSATGGYSSSGLRFESRDGNWGTELQWRAQLRASTPFDSDPRRLSDFAADDVTNFEARRLRMKIGGHGFQPWLEYYFEVDLQPARDVDDSSSAASARVIDWRADIAKWDWGGIRVGQWKVDLNRERVDSSGRQQFVERSIVNDIFTIDRQVGIQVRGRAFKDTHADLRYWAGVFNGEGRGVRNTDDGMMYMGRVQWNFLGRDLAWRQTDVEYTDKPTGSLALAAFTNTGPCTRWSSSGCGNLDGFESPAVAAPDQFETQQSVEEFAFKYRGLSIQQEYHDKSVLDRATSTKYEMTGAYLQSGYFFHHLFDKFPEPLELALRVAQVDAPNPVDRTIENTRKEVTLGANWFFHGHDNKLTLDMSRLTIDDRLAGLDDTANRVRFQWDVSF